MTMTDETGAGADPIPTPEPLRYVLDRGDDPRTSLPMRWDMFEEYLATILMPVIEDYSERERRGRNERIYVRHLCNRRSLFASTDESELQHTDDAWREMATMSAWEADICDDPSLMRPLAAFMREDHARLILDPLALASFDLQGTASQVEEELAELTSAIEGSLSSLRALSAARKSCTDDELQAWHMLYPGWRELRTALLKLRESLDRILPEVDEALR